MGVADDIHLVLDYFGIAPSSNAAQPIFGLIESAISDVLSGRTTRVDRVDHTGLVAAFVGELRRAREASTGSPGRGSTSSDWLEMSLIATSRGRKSVLDVLADSDLAREALDAMDR